MHEVQKLVLNESYNSKTTIWKHTNRSLVLALQFQDFFIHGRHRILQKCIIMYYFFAFESSNSLFGESTKEKG